MFLRDFACFCAILQQYNYVDARNFEECLTSFSVGLQTKRAAAYVYSLVYSPLCQNYLFEFSFFHSENLKPPDAGESSNNSNPDTVNYAPHQQPDALIFANGTNIANNPVMNRQVAIDMPGNIARVFYNMFVYLVCFSL